MDKLTTTEHTVHIYENEHALELSFTDYTRPIGKTGERPQSLQMTFLLLSIGHL